MSEFTICPVNWASFQHYKDRSPAWIKLHRSMILDNPKWHRLPLASKAIAPSIWLLASEGPDGEITSTMEDLAFRLRVSEKEAKAALIPLIEANFFTLVHDASGVLAECLQGASGVLAQRRGEEKRGEEEGEEKRVDEKHTRFLPPSVDDVKGYAAEKALADHAQDFCDFYGSKGWMVGQNKMKDWKLAYSRWCRNQKPGAFSKGNPLIEGTRFQFKETMQEQKDRLMRELEEVGFVD